MRNRITNRGINVLPKMMNSLRIASSIFLVLLSFGSARADTSLADIIAKVKSFPVPGGEVVRQLSPPGVQPRVYLIAMPNVRQHKTEYRSITFTPGDSVKITAGGCVNPGVAISFPPIPPSRRYVDPIDKNGNPVKGLYGLINIPGAINGLQPIKNYNNKTIQIPKSGVNPASLYLSLGYEDSNYGDNTYMPMDPGEKGQCSMTPLPAFVSLTITPAKPASQNSGSNANKETGSSTHQAQPAGSGHPATPGTPSYGAPTTGSASSSYAVTCAPKIKVNTQIDDAWVKNNFGATASSANINPVDVFVSSSSKSQDGTVSCHYKSAKGDIYNLVYKVACKNAVSTGSHSYSCSK